MPGPSADDQIPNIYDVMDSLVLEEEKKVTTVTTQSSSTEGIAEDVAAPNPLVVVFWDKHIRILGTVDDPLFCAKDIARHIGDAHYVRTLKGYKAGATEETGEYLCTITTLDAMGRPQNTLFLTENGLYRYLLRSDLPEAIKFQVYVYKLLKAERKRIIDSALLALKIERTQKAEFQKVAERATINHGIAREELNDVMRIANDARMEVKKTHAKLARLEKQHRGGANARITAAEEANRTRSCMESFKPAY